MAGVVLRPSAGMVGREQAAVRAYAAAEQGGRGAGCSELTSRIREGRMIPPNPPVEAGANAGTVLAGKGSLRRAKSSAPLPAARRSGGLHPTTGGSGGIIRPGRVR